MTTETEREQKREERQPKRREREQQAEELAKKFDAGIQRKIDQGIQKKVDAYRALLERVLNEVGDLPESLRAAIEEAVR